MKPFTHPVFITTGLTPEAVLEAVRGTRTVIITQEEAKVEFIEEGEGCETLEQAVESIVCAAYSYNKRRSLSAADILQRWTWYGVPMPPKPSLDELRAAMVIAAEKPGAVVRWANRERVEAFRDPKASPTGDDEPRLIPVNPFGGLAR